jgi:hypothetical protein
MTRNQHRPYMFDVRPQHRETADSYTARLLAANFETPAHLAQLVREHSTSERKTARRVAERELILAKTKRSALHLEPHPSGWLTHVDGSSCEFCADKLPERWMCTLCAHGEQVKQNPHFDNLVCVKHRRWIGLRTAPDSQRRIGADHIEAARLFSKLRKRRIMDVRLFLLVTDLLRDAASSSAPHTSECASFPRAIQLIWALTRSEFLTAFFNPKRRFVDAHALLTNRVAEVLGEPDRHLTRALWLYLRPTAATLRRSILNGVPFAPAWPHDFPLNTNIAGAFDVGPADLEPFKNYLAVTKDTDRTATQYRGAERNDRTLAADATQGLNGRRSLAICDNGHETRVRSRMSVPTKEIPIACGTCAGQSVQRGENDLSTTHPEIARQFDADLNRGVTAHDIVASSKHVYYWLCRKGHSFEATVASRTYRGTSCAVCLNRVIIPGVNDIQTTHPEVVATWHPTWLSICPPTTVTAGSDQIVLWRCENNHEYSMRIWDRVNGKPCFECTKLRVQGSNANLTITHPGVAAEWHPERNRDRVPDQYTHESRDRVAWLCSFDHAYYQRIHLRAKGYGCSLCAKEARLNSARN